MIDSRTNSGAMSSCAWPACPNARATFRPVEVRAGVVERLAACGMHAAKDDSEALRVWRMLVSNQPPKAEHHDAALADSLAKEVLRVPGISRDRLLRWSRMQAPQQTHEARDADTLGALAALVRDGRLRERKGGGAVAYWSNENDEETPWTTSQKAVGMSAATTAAAATASATTTSSASAPAAAAPTNTTATPATMRTRTATSPLLGTEAEAAATPDNDCNEPATSKPSAAPLDEPVVCERNKPSPALTAPDEASPIAATTASTSLSDSEPAMRVSDKIREYLTKHPDALTAEVAAAIGVPADQTGNALRGMRANGTTVSRKDESARVRGGHTPTRWKLTAATRAKPKPATPVESTLPGGVLEWKARAEKAEAEIADARAISREWHDAVTVAAGLGPSTALGAAAAIARLRDDASKSATLREELGAVSDVVVFEAESFAPEGTMDTSQFVRHTLRALIGRLKASEAREKELLDAAPALPTIDGIPYDAALRLIARAAGVRADDLPSLLAGVVAKAGADAVACDRAMARLRTVTS